LTDDGFTALSRDCDAIQIPYGNTVTLRAGTEVALAQELGGTYTVRTRQGFLLRLDGSDADAIGLQAKAKPAHDNRDAAYEESQVWDQLRSCYDPEIPVNIVDLGLVYGFTANTLDGGGNRVVVQMTLTAPGCGMGQVLKDDIERRLTALPGVVECEVEVVFDPPWNPERMSEAARLQLGFF